MSQWITACAFDAIDDEDVLRFDHAGHSYAIYRYEDKVYATDKQAVDEQPMIYGTPRSFLVSAKVEF